MGDVFAGRYELVDPLGEGGAGVVWRAWDRKRQHYVAAKVLRQVDASSLLRFMREQSMRLDHPHVLAPTGWAGEDEKVLFTMPIVRGGSVATLVSDFGPLPVRLTAVLLDQLLAALEAIHAERIVHRDVKPANLMLDATGDRMPRLWLGDFGIAAGDDAPRLTQGPYAMGTPGYVAPECLHQGWQPDSRADLYAAGMCAVEMLTGLCPVADTDAAEAIHLAERPDPVPGELIGVIDRLTRPQITDRYGTASHARAALRETGLVYASSAQEVLGEVEVFEHIPPLPDGWGDSGPLGETAEAQPDPEEVPAEVPTALMGANTTPPPPVSPGTPASPSTNALAEQSYAAVPQLGVNEPQTVPSHAYQNPGYQGAEAAPYATTESPFREAETQDNYAAYSPTAAAPAAPAATRRSRHQPKRGQGLAVAMILFGLGFVTIAAVLFLALD